MSLLAHAGYCLLMKPLEIEFKRCQPHLGTFFSVSLIGPSEMQNKLNSIFNMAFEKVKLLEETLSFHNSESILSKVNQASPKEEIEITSDFCEVFFFFLELRSKSKGAFSPFAEEYLNNANPEMDYQPQFNQRESRFFLKKQTHSKIDLSGIAKGYIVDRTENLISKMIPNAKGTVNAGGEIKCIGKQSLDCRVRVSMENGSLLYPIVSPKSSIATSSTEFSFEREKSRTGYGVLASRFGTVTALSSSCAVADAMTKVALFGNQNTVFDCMKYYQTDIIGFDNKGEIILAAGF